jgi:hypothetical protein
VSPARRGSGGVFSDISLVIFAEDHVDGRSSSGAGGAGAAIGGLSVQRSGRVLKSRTGSARAG